MKITELLLLSKVFLSIFDDFLTLFENISIANEIAITIPTMELHKSLKDVKNVSNINQEICQAATLRRSSLQHFWTYCSYSDVRGRPNFATKGKRNTNVQILNVTNTVDYFPFWFRLLAWREAGKSEVESCVLSCPPHEEKRFSSGDGYGYT